MRNLPGHVRRTLLLVLPVAVLVGGVVVALTRDGAATPAAAAYEPHPASATEVPFALGAAAPPVFATSDLPPARSAADPATAVTTYLDAARSGRLADAAALLPDGERRRLTSLSSLSALLTESPVPDDAEVLGTETDPTGSGELTVSLRATRTPSLDTVRGLVPAVALESWRVVRVADGYRVSPVAVESRAVLPPLPTATRDAQAWVRAAGACDSAAADRLVVDRVGATALFSTPCAYRGAWQAGAPLAYDDVEGNQPFLDQFGPSVRHWSRFVPVSSPGAPPLLVALAPLGDGWRVMGLLRDGDAP